jgi:putative cell wall-binding protein
MSTQQDRAKSLVDDMLKKHADAMETSLRRHIESQITYYEQVKQRSIDNLVYNKTTEYTVRQQFTYQATLRLSLQEMERTYLELFGKPWDYVEPPIVTPDAVEFPKAKRGRPRKN